MTSSYLIQIGQKGPIIDIGVKLKDSVVTMELQEWEGYIDIKLNLAKIIVF